jgi:hypothetical protein
MPRCLMPLALALAAAAAPAWATPVAGPQAGAGPQTCAALNGLSVAPAVMGLPTRGARVTSATEISAAGSGATAVGAFCRVRAEILPIDMAAPPIRMEVNLPDTWNGKALMYGGGGYNGSIRSTEGTIRLQPPNVQIPLGRGYATFGSDSGHSGNAADGRFAENDEALRNFAFEALKKTRDLAGYLIRLRYGRTPDKVYFNGSSNGGREALAMIEKYPTDLDGAMIFWPAITIGTLQLQAGRIERAMATPEGYINVEKRRLVYVAAVAACDKLDGVADGIVGDVRRCQRVFDPQTAVYEGRPLRCPGGRDEGDGCLSDAQIRTLKTMATPFIASAPLQSGERQYPGFNVWGSDLGTRSGDLVTDTVTQEGFGTLPPAYPAMAGMPFLHIMSDQYIRHFVTRDPHARWAALDPDAAGAWQPRLSALTALLDMNDADLSAFYRRGGKILMVHGLSDQVISPQSTEQYYERVVQTMGSQAVASFFRFYEIPGVSHTGVGIAFTPVWDALGALDNWVTNGQAPVSPVITDTYAVPGRTRPLCEYPDYARYVGGDVNLAASFTCTR